MYIILFGFELIQNPSKFWSRAAVFVTFKVSKKSKITGLKLSDAKKDCRFKRPKTLITLSLQISIRNCAKKMCFCKNGIFYFR